MPEAMQKIRKELGSDAVILNSRKIKTAGFLGMFKKTNIEVIAAKDRQPSNNQTQTKVVDNQKHVHQKAQQLHDSFNPETKTADSSVLEELQELKDLVLLQTKQSSESRFSYPLIKVYEQLIEQEINEELVTAILDELQAKYDGDYPDFEVILKDTKEIMVNNLQQIEFPELDHSKKIHHFVGPTGVGKTTTLAKIAAKYLLTYKKRVAFITTDTYRIAAVEQLRTYAKILNLPMEVAYSKEDYDEALEKFKEYDLILVDTAGRNYRNSQYIKELTEMIQLTEDSVVYLVLSLTAKSEDLLEIYTKFTDVPIKSLILTKMDETTRFGSLYNLPIIYDKGILYITNGQDVPDDLLEINHSEMINMILGAKTNE